MTIDNLEKKIFITSLYVTPVFFVTVTMSSFCYVSSFKNDLGFLWSVLISEGSSDLYTHGGSFTRGKKKLEEELGDVSRMVIVKEIWIKRNNRIFNHKATVSDLLDSIIFFVNFRAETSVVSWAKHGRSPIRSPILFLLMAKLVLIGVDDVSLSTYSVSDNYRNDSSVVVMG